MEAEVDVPELDAACVSHILSFVDDAATIGATLLVSRLWRRCSRDPTLPVWAVMDTARFRALHSWAAPRPTFCACAVVHSLRRGAGRTLRRLDLSTATVCDTCRLAELFAPEARRDLTAQCFAAQPDACAAAQDHSERLAAELNIVAELCAPGRAPGACHRSTATRPL